MYCTVQKGFYFSPARVGWLANHARSLISDSLFLQFLANFAVLNMISTNMVLYRERKQVHLQTILCTQVGMSDDSHFHPAYELGSFDNNLTIDEVTTKFSVDHEAPAITWYSQHRNNTYSFLLYQLRTGPYFIVVAFEASTFATDSPDPILEHFRHKDVT